MPALNSGVRTGGPSRTDSATRQNARRNVSSFLTRHVRDRVDASLSDLALYVVGYSGISKEPT